MVAATFGSDSTHSRYTHCDIFRVNEVDAVDIEQSFTRDGTIVRNQVHNSIRWTDDATHVQGEAIAKPPIRPSSV